ncbi:hypothetical protein [Phaeodactylibacter sp.]|jgi:hypothetical protein|uniref:hypothetical protein n=1 Tax=Phaeodactylibacter sp. TaxID=1940289 RepID=UPI0025E1B94A|nr:hypothetical protein [Phaeodactylibacter sp.]MCI4648947.1 hypothetical protein [Phaeodactylibacter sp.]MCI5091826.1 hypothetical protein [Phaeodactylibacter sp.]
MMWSDLKAVIAWFRGEQEPDATDTDIGVASLMRLVAANTMANIRKAQEQADRLPYQSDEPLDNAPASADSRPTIPFSPSRQDGLPTSDAPGSASAQGDEQEPPQEA